MQVDDLMELLESADVVTLRIEKTSPSGLLVRLTVGSREVAGHCELEDESLKDALSGILFAVINDLKRKL